MENNTYLIPVSTGNDQIELCTNYDLTTYSNTQEQSLFANYRRLIQNISSDKDSQGIVCVFPTYAFLMYTIHFFLKNDWFGNLAEHKIPFIEDLNELNTHEMLNAYGECIENKKNGKTLKDTILFCSAYGYFFRNATGKEDQLQVKWKSMDKRCRQIIMFIGVPYETTTTNAATNVEEFHEEKMVEHVTRCIVDASIVILADYRFMKLQSCLLKQSEYKNAIEEFKKEWLSYKTISISQCLFILQQILKQI